MIKELKNLITLNLLLIYLINVNKSRTTDRFLSLLLKDMFISLLYRSKINVHFISKVIQIILVS